MFGEKASNRRSTDERRAEIAAAAVSCLIDHGYGALTARRVAGAAGISLGHLTYHYANMDDVLAEAYRLVAMRLSVTHVGFDTMNKTPAERLEAYLRAVYAPKNLTPQMVRLRVDLWSAAQANPRIAEIERGLTAEMRAKISAHLTAISDPWKTGRIPMVEAFVMATMDGLWLDFMRHNDPDAVRAAIEACVLFAKMRLGGT